MNKVLFLMMIIAISFSSCKKDWLCECISDSREVRAGFIDTKRKDAKDACDQIKNSFSGSAVTCTLK